MTPITEAGDSWRIFRSIYPVSDIHCFNGPGIVNGNQINILIMGCGYVDHISLINNSPIMMISVSRGSKIKDESMNITEDLLAKSNLTMEDWKWMVNHKG